MHSTPNTPFNSQYLGQMETVLATLRDITYGKPLENTSVETAAVRGATIIAGAMMLLGDSVIRELQAIRGVLINKR